MIPFAAYTAAETTVAFQWVGQPQHIIHSHGHLDRPHLIHGSLGTPESTRPNGISINSAVFAGHIQTLSLVYTSNDVEATCRMLQVERFFGQSRNKLNMFSLPKPATVLPKTATMSKANDSILQGYR